MQTRTCGVLGIGADPLVSSRLTRLRHHVSTEVRLTRIMRRGSTDQTVEISNDSTCSGTPVRISVVNTPLSQIEVKFTSLGGAGVTPATINDCQGGSTSKSFSNETFSGLLLNTYRCTIAIDP